MYTDSAYDHPVYDDIEDLIEKKNYFIAKEKLDDLVNRTSKWHFLYSKVLVHMAWFDSAKHHLETAMAIDPDVIEYKEDYAKLMARHNLYGSSYSKHSSYNGCADGCGECCGEFCVEACVYCCCENLCQNLDCS